MTRRRTELLDAILATELETETIFKRALTGEGTIDDDSRERLLNQTKKMDEDTWAILANILDDMAETNGGGWLAVKRHADNSDVHEGLRDRVYAKINAGILKEKSMKADKDNDGDERAAKTTSKPSAAKEKVSKESGEGGEPSMEVKLMMEMMAKADGDVRNLLDVISDRKKVQEIRMSVYATEKAHAKLRKNKEASSKEEAMEILVGDRLSDPLWVEELCFAVEETATAKLTSSAEAKASANNVGGGGGASAKWSDVKEATNFDNLNRAAKAKKEHQQKDAEEAKASAEEAKAKKKAEAKERHEAEVRKAAEAKAKRVADALVRQEAEAKLAAERRAARKAEAEAAAKKAVHPSQATTPTAALLLV